MDCKNAGRQSPMRSFEGVAEGGSFEIFDLLLRGRFSGRRTGQVKKRLGHHEIVCRGGDSAALL